MTNLLPNYQSESSNLKQDRGYLRKTTKNPRWLRFLKTLFFVILGFLIVGLGLIAFNLNHLGAISKGVIQGKKSLEQGLFVAQSGDLLKASENAKEAVIAFKAAGEQLDKISIGPLQYIPFIAAYKKDARHLAAGGQALSEAMSRGTTYAYGLHEIIGTNGGTSFSKLPVEEKRRILSTIYKAPAELVAIEAALDTSYKEIDAVRSFSWLPPLNIKIQELKEKISNGKKTLDAASPLTQLLPALLGYPETSNYLFILQNSDELRPTGGFIGTYGIIQTKDGDFTRFETHDVYHLDMPVKDKVSITPPEPIKKYLVDKWYLRDANWSPDWPTSAEKILEFYRLENSAMDKPDDIQNFNGVIAITPQLISELMSLTGPITFEDETYTPENFLDLLQYKVEKDFVRLGVPSWHRKEVIGGIAKALKEKLLDLPLDRWPEMIRLVGDTMTRKNVLLYSKDPALEKIIREQQWSGEVEHTWGDYLMAVDANMGALKTDAVLKRNITYTLEPNSAGDLIATATLSYSNPGGPSWKTSRYQSYTRLYVPEGATLIKSSGAVAGSVTSGDELGKTYFGAYIIIPLRSTGQLVFQYKLPRRMAENMKTYKNYSLLVQKQPGSGATSLSVDVRFNNEIKSYNPSNLYSKTPEPGRFTSQGDLTIDRSFLINF